MMTLINTIANKLDYDINKPMMVMNYNTPTSGGEMATITRP
jgi:hypothetical protein